MANRSDSLSYDVQVVYMMYWQSAFSGGGSRSWATQQGEGHTCRVANSRTRLTEQGWLPLLLLLRMEWCLCIPTTTTIITSRRGWASPQRTSSLRPPPQAPWPLSPPSSPSLLQCHPPLVLYNILIFRSQPFCRRTCAMRTLSVRWRMLIMRIQKSNEFTDNKRAEWLGFC